MVVRHTHVVVPGIAVVVRRTQGDSHVDAAGVAVVVGQNNVVAAGASLVADVADV